MGRNYPRHRIRKSSLSLADERAKSAENSPPGHEFFCASEIYFTRPKFLAEDDTRVHTVSRYLSEIRGTSQKYTRKSLPENAAKCTICLVGLSFVACWN